MNETTIIAHRGFWEKESEKNSYVAFQRALEHGFGIETDIRDCSGRLVISHNPPKGNEMLVEEFFSLYQSYHIDAFLALNIKADGLQDLLIPLIERYRIKNYFCFDMSVCDTIPYIEKGLKIASRSSEFEPYLPFYDHSVAVWVDYFKGNTDIFEEIAKYTDDGKYAYIVSSELHKLPHENMWKVLKNITGDFYLCTDYPDKAETYFYGG